MTAKNFEDKQELLDLTDVLAKAYNASDAQAVAALFAENGVFHNSDGGIYTGRDSILAVTQHIMSMGQLQFDLKDALVDEVSGKVVTHWQLNVGISAELTSCLQGVDILHWKEGKLIYKSTFFKTDVPKDLVQ